MPDLAAKRARFKSQLDELEGRQSRIARDLSAPPDRNWDEQAIEMEDDEPLEQQGSLVEREIESVRRAIARIDAATYGKCTRCGGAISEARLEARPEAALCIGCAKRSTLGAGL